MRPKIYRPAEKAGDIVVMTPLIGTIKRFGMLEFNTPYVIENIRHEGGLREIKLDGFPYYFAIGCFHKLSPLELIAIRLGLYKDDNADDRLQRNGTSGS